MHSLFREHSGHKQGWKAARVVLLQVKMSLFREHSGLKQGCKAVRLILLQVKMRLFLEHSGLKQGCKAVCVVLLQVNMSLFLEHNGLKQGWIAVRIVLLLVKMSLFWNTAALDRGGKPSAYFGNSVALVRNETLKCRHCVFVPAKNDTVVIGKLSDSEVIYKIIFKSQLCADKWGLLRLEDWVSGIYSTYRFQVLCRHFVLE